MENWAFEIENCRNACKMTESTTEETPVTVLEEEAFDETFCFAVSQFIQYLHLFLLLFLIVFVELHSESGRRIFPTSISLEYNFTNGPFVIRALLIWSAADSVLKC